MADLHPITGQFRELKFLLLARCTLRPEIDLPRARFFTHP